MGHALTGIVPGVSPYHSIAGSTPLLPVISKAFSLQRNGQTSSQCPRTASTSFLRQQHRLNIRQDSTLSNGHSRQ
ncbi:hypothetical protein X777_07265 [Ooceraea biroi]|uniref:Uncharacterized protein n=1 Tax=Ooceraea biroi TaxID=2015173 RepID=A0A026WAG6_OOCBI|nr:hypothetical protein X777_07265 [Ooceraea biroi]